MPLGKLRVESNLITSPAFNPCVALLITVGEPTVIVQVAIVPETYSPGAYNTNSTKL